MSRSKPNVKKGDTVIEIDPTWLTRLITEGELIPAMLVSEGLPPHSTLVGAEFNQRSGLLELSFVTPLRKKRKGIQVRYEMREAEVQSIDG